MLRFRRNKNAAGRHSSLLRGKAAGTSLFEVMVAVAVGSVGLLGIAALMATSGKSNRAALEHTLAGLAAQALTEEAHLYPLRDAYQFSQTGLAPAGTAGIGPMSGNWTAPNPPYGAVFTYSVNGGFGDDKLVLNITDDSGKQIRRLDLDKSPGLRRIAWNLRGETPPQNPADQGRGFGGGGGRGGNQAPPAAPGRYRATIARVAGDKVTPVGQGVSFSVLPIDLK